MVETSLEQVAPPRRAEEVRVAFSPGNLVNYIKASKAADQQRLQGEWRVAHFLIQAPNVPDPDVPFEQAGLSEQLSRFRQRVSQTRLARDSRFGRKIREQYDYSCAVCGVQLEIVEGAHIIPVNEQGSRDELWNGIAMCPNHHTLFDSRSFVVTAKLRVRVDQDVVQFLRETGSDTGIETLTDHNDELIRKPHFSGNVMLMTRMREALALRAGQSGIQ